MKNKSNLKWIIGVLVLAAIAYGALHLFSSPKIINKFSDGPSVEVDDAK